MQQQPPPPPFIVKIIQPPDDPSGLGELGNVLMSSIGLTGLIVLAAAVAGLILAGVLYWVRSRQA